MWTISRRLLHQYKIPQFGPCLRKWTNGGGGLSGMEYENENLNFFCLISPPKKKKRKKKNKKKMNVFRRFKSLKCLNFEIIAYFFFAQLGLKVAKQRESSLPSISTYQTTKVSLLILKKNIKNHISESVQNSEKSFS